MVSKRLIGSVQGSVWISLVFHIAMLFLLNQQSLWFSGSRPSSSKTGGALWISSMEKKDKNEILKEAFAPTPSPDEGPDEALARANALPLGSKIQWSLRPIDSNLLPIDKEQFTEQQRSTPFPPTALLATGQQVTILLPQGSRYDLFEHLPKDLIVPVKVPSHSTELPPLSPVAADCSPALKSPHVKPELPKQFGQQEKTAHRLASVWDKERAAARAPSHLPEVHLPALPTLSELETVSFSDAFDAELVFWQDDHEGDDILFALTLVPRADLGLKKIAQTYHFMIDRSNSVQKERLQATKSAVRKAMEELGEGDFFNIYVFDSKLDKLFPKPMAMSKGALAQADAFLKEISLGSFFSPTDLARPLFLATPPPHDEGLHVGLLFTDAEGLAKKPNLQALLTDWTRYNDGRLALYTIGFTADVQKEALHMLASLNRGRQVLIPTKRALKRKLTKLMRTLHTAVGQNLSLHVVRRSPGGIEVFPDSNHTAHLYLNEPYVILGRTKTMDDFVIFVQGKLQDRWLHIKKTISFLNAKKGDLSLRDEWVYQKAFEFYRRYLKEGDAKYIAE
ncbi:MAG: hypothetical protein RL235_1204, partial [Chlamydiota bacterium]